MWTKGNTESGDAFRKMDLATRWPKEKKLLERSKRDEHGQKKPNISPSQKSAHFTGRCLVGSFVLYWNSPSKEIR